MIKKNDGLAARSSHAPLQIESIGRREFVKGVAAVALTGYGLTPKLSLAGAANAYDLSLSDAALAIKNGDMTSEFYTQQLLARARSRSGLNSFITIDADSVLEAAHAADKARAAGKVSPLLGVPVAVKDSYMTRGVATTFGSAVADGFLPKQDADVVTSIKQAGALVFGKNNLVEMSYGLTGFNAHHGQVKNPYNPKHITGGSSSGAAASVAARIVPAALGGDTVGSIRVPASLCGVVGFKPTPGRWSSNGVAPISETLDTTGVLARDVDDCALMDAVVTGILLPVQTGLVGLKGVRLAYAPRQFLTGADPDVEALFWETLRKLKDAGASLIEVDLGSDFSAIAARATWGIFFHETMPAISEFIKDYEVPFSFAQFYEGLGPQIKDHWSQFVLPAAPGHLSEAAYDAILTNDRPEMQRRYAETVFARADALIFPTTLCTAPPIASQWNFPVAGKMVSDVFLSRNTYPGSCAGLPGVSLPMGLLSNQLPVGLEIDANIGRDRSLLELVKRIELVIGWGSAPPML
ncbi:amidase family protein [Caballeronia sp. 15715]|uniref:amidase family protein n=1 Tax=unclassified Caballeronia TaxID=2646786 RepID=UPI0039E65BC7